MTDPMISPDNQPRNAVTAATRSAAIVTAALGGARRAAEDLAADRAGEPVPLRRRGVDLSTPAGRIRFGYLGVEARGKLAELFEALDEVDTALLPLGLVASREAARQALRLSALADDERLPDCPACEVVGAGLADLGATLRAANVGKAPAAVESVRGQL